MQKNMVLHDYIVHGFLENDDRIRALVSHVLTIESIDVVKSEYSVLFDKEQDVYQCTCKGFLMGGKECVHLKAFKKYLNVIKK